MLVSIAKAGQRPIWSPYQKEGLEGPQYSLIKKRVLISSVIRMSCNANHELWIRMTGQYVYNSNRCTTLMQGDTRGRGCVCVEAEAILELYTICSLQL